MAERARYSPWVQQPPLGSVVASVSVGVGAYAIAVAAMLTTTAAVLAGGWIQGAGAAFIVAAVAVTEAILLGRSGLGRLGALLLAVPLCAAVVIPVTIGIVPADTPPGFWHLLGSYLAAAATGLFATDNWAFTVGLATIVWLCGFWLGWLAFRERRGILAVIPAVVVLAVNALNAPTLENVGAPEALALVTLVLLVGNVELGSLAAGWRWRRVPTLPRLQARFTGSMVGVAALIVIAGLILPPATTTDFSGLLFPGSGNGQGGGASASKGGSGGVVQFSTSTVPGGTLQSQPRPVLNYVTDRPVPIYLRVVNDTVFLNGAWLPDDAAGAGPVNSNTSLPVNDAIGPGGLLRDTAVLGAATAPVKLTITQEFMPPTAPGYDALFAGEPVNINHEAVVSGTTTDGQQGSPFQAVDSVTLINDADPYHHNLVTTALIPTATEAQLRSAGTNYPAFTSAEATLVPAADAPSNDPVKIIHDLAVQWTQGATNPYDQAKAIEEHLRRYPYTLNPPAPPAGEWPIVFFLEGTKGAYCQYFASSMGAMLRTLGIPSRVVSGYGPGTANTSENARQAIQGVPGYRITTSDAHSWVEAYFPGYGWIPFEPTPGSTLGNYVPFSRGPQGPAPTAAPIPRTTPRPDQATTTPVGATPQTGSSLGAWIVPVIAALALAALVVSGIGWWRRPRSLAGVWKRLGIAARLVGVRRDPAETRADYADRLAGALGPRGQPVLRSQLDLVAEVSGKAEFCPGGLDDADRNGWRGAWSEIARQIPSHLQRRRRHGRRPWSRARR